MHATHVTTAEMNPAIDPDWLEERRREDPELYAREFEAQWIDGASSYLDSADVVACVRGGVDKLAAAHGVNYVASLDPGYSVDSFAVAIGHKDSEGAVIDGVWTWRKHGHERTLDAIADVCHAYKMTRVTTDQHCAVPIVEGLAKRSIIAVLKPWTNESKSNSFAALKVGLNTRAISLPDDPALTEELCALEATPTPSGLTRISAISGSHDDRAVAVAAVVAQLTASAATMTSEQIRAARQLLDELATPAGSRPAFSDLVGVPGVPGYGFGRL
jgi:hypothetical protein